MTIYIDPPNAAGHGRLWSHLASDTSYAELHAFAAQVGIPERGFDRDHYDVPAERYADLIAAGAVPISSRGLTELLQGAGLRRRKTEVLRPRRHGQQLLLPAPLVAGDRIAVLSPAGPTPAARLVDGLAALSSWGLVPELVIADESELPWLAGPDHRRADLLTQAWLDPGVRAVWCTRGGYGTQRILDLLDWAALRRADPAWLIGMSDITALHQGFASQLGVATVHGPGVAELGVTDVTSQERVRSLLFEESSARLPTAPIQGEPGVDGSAQATLVGGNLTMLASSIGTSVASPATDSIALLEDINEVPYRLDRSLTQLLRSGWFDGVRGVACGQFTDCGDPELLRQLLFARLSPLGVPVVFSLPIGHSTPNLAVLLGREVVLDGTTGQLRP